jgi:hypothetical protein
MWRIDQNNVESNVTCLARNDKASDELCRGLYHPSMHTSELWDTENYVVNY